MLLDEGGFRSIPIIYILKKAGRSPYTLLDYAKDFKHNDIIKYLENRFGKN